MIAIPFLKGKTVDLMVKIIPEGLKPKLGKTQKKNHQIIGRKSLSLRSSISQEQTWLNCWYLPKPWYMKSNVNWM